MRTHNGKLIECWLVILVNSLFLFLYLGSVFFLQFTRYKCKTNGCQVVAAPPSQTEPVVKMIDGITRRVLIKKSGTFTKTLCEGSIRLVSASFTQTLISAHISTRCEA